MSKPLNWFLIKSFIVEEMQSQRDIRENATFLDIGCGDMQYKDYCIKEGWLSVFSDYEARSEKISLRLDAHKLPFGDSSFDIVLMSEVLEHLPQPKQSLREIFRIMKPGGTLLLTTPFIYGMHEVPCDYFRYTEFGLNTLLDEVGLDMMRFQRRGELIGVILSIFGIFVFGTLEFLSRNRILFFFGKVLTPVAEISERLVIALYMGVFKRRLAMFFASPGNDLGGIMGQLSLWHLGYNVVCHKK